MSIIKNLFILVLATLLLSACGGGDEAATGATTTDTGDTATTDTGASATSAGSAGGSVADTGVPAAIAITYPSVDTLTHLIDPGGKKSGVYSYAGTVIVTDKHGNAVTDGTVIQLDVIDTILAKGTIGTEESAGDDLISSTNFADLSSSTISQGIIAASDFSTANVDDNGSAIGIDEGSLVIITHGADKQDLVRKVSSVTGNTITTTTAYNGTYPEPDIGGTYLTGKTTYVVGKTTVGMDILGIDPDTGEKLIGFSKTINGKAHFRLEYPANDNTIFIGCGSIPENYDYRYPRHDGIFIPKIFDDPDTVDKDEFSLEVETRPDGSRDVWVIAQVDGNPALTIVDDQACFAAAAPTALTTTTPTVNYVHKPDLNKFNEDYYGTKVALYLHDKEEVGLPFVRIKGHGKDVDKEPTTAVTAAGTDCITEVGGGCVVYVKGNSTDTITYTAQGTGGNSVTITIN